MNSYDTPAKGRNDESVLADGNRAGQHVLGRHCIGLLMHDRWLGYAYDACGPEIADGHLFLLGFVLKAREILQSLFSVYRLEFPVFGVNGLTPISLTAIPENQTS